MTSNGPTNNRDEFFGGDGMLPCVPDRLFDRSNAFITKGSSYRNAEPEVFL